MWITRLSLVKRSQLPLVKRSRVTGETVAPYYIYPVVLTDREDSCSPILGRIFFNFSFLTPEGA